MAESETVLVPLRNWVKNEADKITKTTEPNKKLICCQTTVAYGIAELLLLRANNNHAAAKINNGQSLEEEIRIDNFAVCVKKDNPNSTRRPWDDVGGVSMISPAISISIGEPSYLSCLMLDDDEEWDGEAINGRCLEVEMTSPLQENLSTASVGKVAGDKRSIEGDSGCLSLLAKLLYELFFVEPLGDDTLTSDEDDSKQPESKLNHHPRKKRMLSRAQVDFDQRNSTRQVPEVLRLQKSGLPASLCLLIEHLFGSDLGEGDAYTSLEDVAKDLHLLLLEPDRFLFDKEVDSSSTSESIQLCFREGKLYGRDKEESLITDAFVRVSRGTSEAVLIGGFSGSGKSMLVNSIRSKVGAVGGYVIKHKFDNISQINPLQGVISAFNGLCQRIRHRSTAQGLAMIAKQLREDFGIDFNLLLRLLPNVRILSPVGSPASPVDFADENVKMNIQSVCFTLVRFLRVVSSPRCPVMLFLDDIQWADGTALGVIHKILCDTMGSCMLFVGAYRDNEVQAGHAVFDLMENLKVSKVQTTNISLAGLDRENLNTLISDALCLYPRICRSFTDIVFEKTKGNPFFVLEFMQSLVGRGLLQYNFHMKRWVWNEAATRPEQCMDNVLYLLSSKMAVLTENVRTLLKVMACFGTITTEFVIDSLSKSTEYSDIQDSLKIAIRDGFIARDEEGNCKFVHDKVREAAYNLIPDNEKKRFHYNLGIILNSNCDGGDVDEGDGIFIIASQINYGEEYTLKNRDSCMKVLELNMKAGKRALDGFDHKTAYSFLKTSFSHLPDDHWESYYQLSLRIGVLMARASYSCGNFGEAESILQGILEKASSTKDKLPAYSLLGTMYQTQGKVVDAVNLYSSILSQLGETIPESSTAEASTAMVAETLNMFEETFVEAWIQTKMEESLCFIPQFYCEMVLAAYFCKPRPYITFIACKATQLCLRNGMCKFAPLCFLQFAVLANNEDNLQRVYRIGKNAISLRRGRISDCYYPFYGGVAMPFENFQLCADKLTQAFTSGLSDGNFNIGIYCIMQAKYIDAFCGKNLRSLLEEIDRYLNICKSYQNEVGKNYLLSTRETVSTLIDKGQETCIEAKASYGDMENPSNKQREMYFFHEAIRCFWLGYTERFKRFASKCLEIIGHLPQFNTYQIKFYHGLYLIQSQKKKKSKETLRLAIAAGRELASMSEHNFLNKKELLEAELYSFEKKNDSALASYDSSIASARNSRFTHEQGLACERAGFHCKKVNDKGRALQYFQQARECYEEWGSSVKVDFIKKEMDNLNM